MENIEGNKLGRDLGDSYLYIGKVLLWIVIVCAVGFFAVNQAFVFFYGVHLLKAPCDLCAELNPGVEECIKELNEPRESFYNGSGYSDPWNEPLNFTTEK